MKTSRMSFLFFLQKLSTWRRISIGIILLLLFFGGVFYVNKHLKTDRNIMHLSHNQDYTWFSHVLKNTALINKLKNIKLIVSDIDGSLTDGSIGYTDEKESSRRFSIQDGFATVKALNSGLLIAFLSGKEHRSAQLRAKKLGIPEDLCIGGKEEKLTFIQSMQQAHGVSSTKTLMFGDDFLDARIKTQDPTILYVAPCNAPFYLQPLADLVVPRPGGNDAFRLLLDLILYVQGNHFAQDLIDASLTQQQ